jgi:hypothetical protein
VACFPPRNRAFASQRHATEDPYSLFNYTVDLRHAQRHRVFNFPELNDSLPLPSTKTYKMFLGSRN